MDSTATGTRGRRLLERRSEATVKRLPERVRQTVDATRASSERLIGWAQLIVVGLFSTLYFVSPPAHDGMPYLHPEPWFLGAYLLFTIARLWLAYRSQLPPWLLYLSSALDIALLLGLIWTFHVKYGQPPTFYLKAPTLLYVFIFISLRALRFEARYVLFAGLCAVVGWMAMVAYALAHASETQMLTRDYVEYLTSNSVLIGAEIDKVISIALVTAILAVAIHRARQLLEVSVQQAVAVEELSRFVPEAVATRVREADTAVEAGQAETGVATVLYTDIEGFTSITESMEPEDLIVALNEYFAALSEPIERRGGVLSQFQGDAVLAIFNMPTPDPAHASHALEAAVEIQAAVRGRRFGGSRGVELPTRIGINTGDVVGGFVGTSDRLHYTVHGDTVNLAARLEQLNKQLGTRIVLSDATRAALRGEPARLRSAGRVELRGHREALDVWTVATPH